MPVDNFAHGTITVQAAGPRVDVVVSEAFHLSLTPEDAEAFATVLRAQALRARIEAFCQCKEEIVGGAA